MGEVIDFRKATQRKKDFSDLYEFNVLAEKLRKLSISNAELSVVKEYMLEELRVFLGLCLVDEEAIEEIEPIFFGEIFDVYNQANEHCYFCSDIVDPNEESYGEVRGACPVCLLKLKSFLFFNHSLKSY